MSEPFAALAERIKQTWDTETHRLYIAASEYYGSETVTMALIAGMTPERIEGLGGI